MGLKMCSGITRWGEFPQFAFCKEVGGFRNMSKNATPEWVCGLLAIVKAM
jgi:hypothetical protein